MCGELDGKGVLGSISAQVPLALVRFHLAQIREEQAIEAFPKIRIDAEGEQVVAALLEQGGVVLEQHW